MLGFMAKRQNRARKRSGLNFGANTGFDFQKESLDFILTPRVLGFQNGVEEVELFLSHVESK